jgi:hypothetical protein
VVLEPVGAAIRVAELDLRAGRREVRGVHAGVAIRD